MFVSSKLLHDTPQGNIEAWELVRFLFFSFSLIIPIKKVLFLL